MHAWALAPAAIGTCCLAADRRRMRAPELAASVLMLFAMLDAASARLVPPVYWAAALLLSAMLLAALRGPRSTAARRAPHSTAARRIPRSIAARRMHDFPANVRVPLRTQAVHSRPRRALGAGSMMTVHTTVGMVAMAALLLAMGHADASAGAHVHGVSAATLVIVMVGGATAYAVGSAVAFVRAHGWIDRSQHAAMGAATLVMGLALLG
ncbi:MAG: hypothetical protein KKH75_06700, partial [Actinobacteria bacterium]|nr:hypothetical protein [Actinomycetota bacterium]